jgi:hypothetical protein
MSSNILNQVISLNAVPKGFWNVTQLAHEVGRISLLRAQGEQKLTTAIAANLFAMTTSHHVRQKQPLSLFTSMLKFTDNKMYNHAHQPTRGASSMAQTSQWQQIRDLQSMWPTFEMQLGRRKILRCSSSSL